jgi:hypothetical protein
MQRSHQMRRSGVFGHSRDFRRLPQQIFAIMDYRWLISLIDLHMFGSFLIVLTFGHSLAARFVIS